MHLKKAGDKIRAFQYAKILDSLNSKLSFVKTRFVNRLNRFLRKYPLIKFRSVKFEISVIYTLILGIVLISFSGIFYIITSRTLYQELDNELKSKAANIAENIRSYLDVRGEKPQSLQYAVEQTIAREDQTLQRWWFVGFERNWFQKLDEQDLSRDFVNFAALDKSLTITSTNVTTSLLTTFLENMHIDPKETVFWNMDTEDADIRVINFPYPPQEKTTHLIQIGISKGPLILLLKKWMASVLISIPVILILTGFIGRLLASRILRPLNRIINTATNISYENLNLRVEPKLHYREMNRLIRTFNGMISRLEKSFKHIDEFSTHVAHELKTPLTIIRGEAELSYFAAKSPETRKSNKIIIEEIDNVLKTIEDLLFLGKTQYQPDSFCFNDVYLNQFLQEISDQFKFIVMTKNIELKIHKLSKNIIIRGDKLHLRRLFFNLIDNAIKFTPENGVITISTRTTKDNVYIQISDTGKGISPQNLDKIFDQFFREEKTGKGVGLGLSIAKAIVKAHNGNIRVENVPSQGTTFIVSFPYLRAPVPSMVS